MKFWRDPNSFHNPHEGEDSSTSLYMDTEGTRRRTNVPRKTFIESPGSSTNPLMLKNDIGSLKQLIRSSHKPSFATFDNGSTEQTSLKNWQQPKGLLVDRARLCRSSRHGRLCTSSVCRGHFVEASFLKNSTPQGTPKTFNLAKTECWTRIASREMITRLWWPLLQNQRTR
ncbi:unnamed protein product [Caenorhabditis brenneri]